MIVVSHHVRASRLHNLHTCNLAESVPLTVCTWKISKQITRNDNHWIWKRKLLVVISQLFIVVHRHGIHASRSCKSAVTHKVHQNQDLTTKLLFFFCSFKQFFFSCFPYEQLQFSRFDSHLILKSKVVSTNICVQQFSHYC